MRRTVGVACVILALSAAPAFAQEVKLLEKYKNWSVYTADNSGIEGKRAVGICVAGGGGGGGPSCTVSLEKVLRTCGFDVVDVVPARRQNLDMKCDVLVTTGKWLAGG